MTKKPNELGLSKPDKVRASHGFGHDFPHTEPQRRVPCVVGDMLCPRSADDIPPITPEAMASVQAGLALLANLVADRDHNLYLSQSGRQSELEVKAREILLAGKGLAGILRVAQAAPPVEVVVELRVSLTAGDVAALKMAAEHVRVHMAHQHSWDERDAAMAAIGKVIAAVEG